MNWKNLDLAVTEMKSHHLNYSPNPFPSFSVAHIISLDRITVTIHFCCSESECILKMLGCYHGQIANYLLTFFN